MRKTILATRIELLAGLQRVTKAIPARSPMPVLENVVIRATDAGITTFTATNLDTTVIAEVITNTDAPVEILLPAKRLLDIVRALPDGDVRIDIEEGLWVTIHGGRSHTTIPGLSTDEYPKLLTFASEQEAQTLSAEDVASIKRAAAFASTDEFRPAMTGVLLSDDTSSAVATDGFRLVQRPLASYRANTPLILQTEAVKALDLFDAEVEIRSNATHVEITDGATTVISRLIDEQYPNWGQLIPTGSETVLTFDRQILTAALKRVMLAANAQTRQVQLQIAGETAWLAARDKETMSEGIEQVEAEIGGDNPSDDMRIAFNGQFLQAALEQAGTESVEIGLTTALRPALITSPGSTVRQLLMPIRINEGDEIRRKKETGVSEEVAA